MASNSVFFTSPDADFSGLTGAIYHQTFLPTYAGSLYALYLFGSGFPKDETYDYTRNGRTLTKTGTPTLSTGYATTDTSNGYTAPFSAIDFGQNGAGPCSIIAFCDKQTTTATGTAVRSGNTVASVTVTAGGGPYNSAPSVSFSGGGGSGAAGTAVLNASGAVTSVTITNAGSGYTSDPTVTFSAPSGNFLPVSSYNATSTSNMMGVALRNTNDSRYIETIHHSGGSSRNIGFTDSLGYTGIQAAGMIMDAEEDYAFRWRPGISAATTAANTAQTSVANGGTNFSIGLRLGGSTANTIYGTNIGRIRGVAFYQRKLTLAEFEDACEQFETRYGEVVGTW